MKGLIMHDQAFAPYFILTNAKNNKQMKKLMLIVLVVSILSFGCSSVEPCFNDRDFYHGKR